MGGVYLVKRPCDPSPHDQPNTRQQVLDGVALAIYLFESVSVLVIDCGSKNYMNLAHVFCTSSETGAKFS